MKFRKDLDRRIYLSCKAAQERLTEALLDNPEFLHEVNELIEELKQLRKELKEYEQKSCGKCRHLLNCSSEIAMLSPDDGDGTEGSGMVSETHAVIYCSNFAPNKICPTK